MHTQELCWQEIVNKIAQEGISWPSVFIGRNWQENTLLLKKKIPVQTRWKSLLWCFPYFPTLEQENSYQHLVQKQAFWLPAKGSSAVKTFLWLIQYLMVTTAFSKECSALQQGIPVLLLTCFSYFKHFFLKQIY